MLWSRVAALARWRRALESTRAPKPVRHGGVRACLRLVVGRAATRPALERRDSSGGRRKSKCKHDGRKSGEAATGKREQCTERLPGAPDERGCESARTVQGQAVAHDANGVSGAGAGRRSYRGCCKNANLADWVASTCARASHCRRPTTAGLPWPSSPSSTARRARLRWQAGAPQRNGSTAARLLCAHARRRWPRAACVWPRLSSARSSTERAADGSDGSWAAIVGSDGRRPRTGVGGRRANDGGGRGPPLPAAASQAIKPPPWLPAPGCACPALGGHCPCALASCSIPQTRPLKAQGPSTHTYRRTHIHGGAPSRQARIIQVICLWPSARRGRLHAMRLIRPRARSLCLCPRLSSPPAAACCGPSSALD